MVCVQWTIASIPETDTEKFDDRVVELERTSRWRYGYAWQFHGVVLVKARNVPGAPPLVPIDADDRLSLVMARQLRLRIWKAGFELLFYAALQLLIMTGLPRLTAAIAGTGATRCRLAAAIGIANLLLVTAALAPYLLIGYGEPLFSTRQGPGAFSSSGLTSPATAAVGPSITYRAVIEGVLRFPLLSSWWALDFLEPLGERVALWAVSAAFYATIGALMGYAAEACWPRDPLRSEPRHRETDDAGKNIAGRRD